MLGMKKECSQILEKIIVVFRDRSSIQQESEMRGLSKRVERIESRRGWVWVVKKCSKRACWLSWASFERVK